MKISGEEVELVTSFESLRAGMIVWVHQCQWCDNESHRGMLLGPEMSHFVFDNSEANYSAMAFDVVPSPPCVYRDAHSNAYAVDAEDVDNRYIYRVVDPLLDAAPVTRAKELAR